MWWRLQSVWRCLKMFHFDLHIVFDLTATYNSDMCNGCSMLLLLAQIPQHFSPISSVSLFFPVVKQHTIGLHTHTHIEPPKKPYITLCRNNKCELRFWKQHLFCNLDVYFSSVVGSWLALCACMYSRFLFIFCNRLENIFYSFANRAVSTWIL